MTAIHPDRITRGRTALALAALGAFGLVSACSEQRVVPPPRPAPPPAARPLPPPPPPPKQTDWRRAPATPGDWIWSVEAGQSTARFAGGALVLRCDRAAGAMVISRAATSASPGPVVMTIRTFALSRNLSATSEAGPPASITARVPAGDPLLDAMALSRGKFALEVPGSPALMAPSWSEVSRVIEDCR